MTDEFVQREGHRVNDKVSLIKGMWPDHLPEVEVNVEGYPEENLIGFQVSTVIDGDRYGVEIPEDVDDHIEVNEFDAVLQHQFPKFENLYSEKAIQ